MTFPKVPRVAPYPCGSWAFLVVPKSDNWSHTYYWLGPIRVIRCNNLALYLVTSLACAFCISLWPPWEMQTRKFIHQVSSQTHLTLQIPAAAWSVQLYIVMIKLQHDSAYATAPVTTVCCCHPMNSLLCCIFVDVTLLWRLSEATWNSVLWSGLFHPYGWERSHVTLSSAVTSLTEEKSDIRNSYLMAAHGR